MSGSCTIHTAGLAGDRAWPVEVEVTVPDDPPTLDGWEIDGLSGSRASDARAAARVGIRSAGYELPRWARASVRGSQMLLDLTGIALPIAVGALVASGQVPADVADAMLYGKLGIDGGIGASRGLEAARQLAESQGRELVCNPRGASRGIGRA